MPRPNPVDTAYHAYLYRQQPEPLLTAVREAAYRQAVRKCKPEDAEDIAQLVTQAVYCDLHRIRPTLKLSTWVHGITKHKIADHHRSTRPTDELPPELAPAPAPAPTPLPDLTPDERLLLHWRSEGYSYADMASMTGVSLGALTKRVFDLRKRLRQGKIGDQPERLTVQRLNIKAAKAGPLPTPPSLTMGPDIIERYADGDPATVAIVEGWRPSYRVIYARTIPDNDIVY